jgi:hypothetical protein
MGGGTDYEMIEDTPKVKPRNAFDYLPRTERRRLTRELKQLSSFMGKRGPNRKMRRKSK